MNQQSARADADCDSEPESAGKRAIHLEYYLYICAAANSQLPKPSSAPKWEKTKHSGDIIWKTNIGRWTWEDFKKKIIQKLDQIRRNYFGVYVHEQDRADLISWRCILHMHRTYGVRAGFCAKNEEDFAAFVEAADNNPANKIIIHLTMDDPGAQAKKLE